MSVRSLGGRPGDTGPTPGGGEKPPPRRSLLADESPASRRTSLELANAAKSVPLARAVVIDLLRRNGHDGAVEVAGLLTSELVTNAVVHGATDIGMVATLSDRMLRVEASDSSSQVPTVRCAGVSETAGRGLVVLTSLASDWGYEVRSSGKVVWFELAL